MVEKFNLMDSDDLYNELDQVVPLIGLSASDAATAISRAALKAICVL